MTAAATGGKRGLWSALRASWSGEEADQPPPVPEHLPLAIFHVDLAYRIGAANAAALELVGLQDDWHGAKLRHWLPGVKELRRRPASRTRAGQQLHDLTLNRADGTRVPVEVCVTRIEEEWFAVSITDLSDRQARMDRLSKTNDRLMQARDDALELSRAKTLTLARVAKAFQEPLGDISGRADLLAHDAIGLGQGMRDDIRRIGEDSGRLLDLLRTVVDLSAIESGRMAVLQRPIDIGDDIEELVARQQEEAKEYGNTLEFVRFPEVGEAFADRERVVQIIDTLLDNALQHTDDGTVTVKLFREPMGGDDRIMVEVTDTGAGIPEERMATLFDGHEPDAEDQSPGIGLLVCSALARLMGGRLSATSTKGAGSTFTLDLPAFTTQHDEQPPKLSATGQPVPRRVSQTMIQVDVRDDQRLSDLAACLRRGGWGVHPLIGLDGTESPSENDVVVVVAPGPKDDPIAMVEHARARNPELPLIAVLHPDVDPPTRLQIATLATVRTVEEDADGSSWDDALHASVMRAVMMRSLEQKAEKA